MILLAYAGALVLAVLASILGAGWTRAGRPGRITALRTVAGVVATGYALAVLVAVSYAQADGGSAWAWGIPLVAITGATLYVSGLIRWHRADGYPLRLAGWVGMAVAAAVPSHLTLLLPVVALLVLALFRPAR